MKGKVALLILPLSLALFVASNPAIASGELGFNWSSDLAGTFSEFSGSQAYEDLANSEFSAKNYAEVIVTNSNSGSIVIIQGSSGWETNKAKVVRTSSDNSDALIVQRGEANTAVIEQANGSHNFALLEQYGSEHIGYVSQDGSDNFAVLKQCALALSSGCASSSEASEISISQTNDGNVAAIYDSSNQSYGIVQNGGDGILVINNMSRGISIRQ